MKKLSKKRDQKIELKKWEDGRWRMPLWWPIFVVDVHSLFVHALLVWINRWRRRQRRRRRRLLYNFLHSIFTLIFTVGRLKIKPEKFSFTMVQPNLRISIGLIANWSQFDIQALLQKLLKFSYPCWMGPSPSTPLRVHSWMIQFGSFRCAQMARFLFNSKAIQNLFNSKFFLPK